MQHTATHWNTLQHTAAHCNTLQHNATHKPRDADIIFNVTHGCERLTYTQQQHTHIHTHTHTHTHTHAYTHARAHARTRCINGSRMRNVASTCAASISNFVRCENATHCNTLQHTAAHCNTLQHTASHCNTLQHAPIRYRKISGAKLQHAATHCTTL